MEKSLPSIPAKRYFTIGEVSELCGVKPHVLRYWEQEFTQLRPMKRRGNRRYYQHHEVLMIRRIRDLLYEQGFTISGARNKLQEIVQGERDRRRAGEVLLEGVEPIGLPEDPLPDDPMSETDDPESGVPARLAREPVAEAALSSSSGLRAVTVAAAPAVASGAGSAWGPGSDGGGDLRLWQVRRELAEIRDLLSAALDRNEAARDSRAII